MYAIEVNNVSKKYALYNKPFDRLRESLSIFRKSFHKEFNALNPLSFKVAKGECFGIIGVNGSGKSTLLKILTDVLTPTTGTYSVNGRVSALLELGAGFNVDFTGLENIYLNGTIMGYSKEEMDQRVDAIKDFADIGEFINQPVKTYSSGMFARLAFAVAINVDPDILIVDEALSVGDIYFQAKCYKKFDEFKSKGKTIIFVTHDIGSVLKYCDEVMLLNKGDLIGIGSPAEMVDLFKKILSNQTITVASEEKKESYEGEWKKHLAVNPNPINYGSLMAEIVDFAIVDDKGRITNTVIKDTFYEVKVKVHFKCEVKDPIVSYKLRTTKGVELTGTNTFLEGISFGTVKAGETIEVTFKQKMLLQGAQYLLGLGCTKYQSDDTLEVFHRLHDIANVDVVSKKNSVGYFDSNSEITIKR